jgi:predicted transcriptional regulator
MKTIETVYNKLNNAKTELETHKIELSLVDDLKELKNKFDKEITPIYKEVSKEKNKLRAKAEKAEQILDKVDNQIEQKLKLVEKTAKDLGISVSEINDYKSLKSLLSIVPDMKTVFKSVQ